MINMNDGQATKTTTLNGHIIKCTYLLIQILNTFFFFLQKNMETGS